MDTRDTTGRLEILSAEPRRRSALPPLLFVHGAFAGAWCWAEHFLPYFAEQGFSAHALSLRGHGASQGREHLDWHSISDYVADVDEAIARLDAVPVLIGHSMGGLVVQKYFERAAVPAAVLMASVPPQGLMSASMQLALKSPDLFREINSVFHGGRTSAEALGRVLFAKSIDEDSLRRYNRLMQPESQRAIWDMALFNLPQRWLMHVPPLLVLGAEFDALIPASFAEATANYYGVAAEIVPGMGHGLMLEPCWEAVAKRIAAWITAAIAPAA